MFIEAHRARQGEAGWAPCPHLFFPSVVCQSSRCRESGATLQCTCMPSLSCPTLWTPWTVAYQTPLSMGFSRQEDWSGLTFPPPGDPPDPGIEPGSPALQADSLSSEPPGKPYLKFKFKNSNLQYTDLNQQSNSLLCFRTLISM